MDPEGGNHKEIGDWDSEAHLEQCTKILVDFIQNIQFNRPRWTKEQQLKGLSHSLIIISLYSDHHRIFSVRFWYKIGIVSYRERCGQPEQIFSQRLSLTNSLRTAMQF